MYVAACLEHAVLGTLAPQPVDPDLGGDRPHSAFPRIGLGHTGNGERTADGEAREELVTLHVWSRSSDGAEASALLDAIRNRLSGAALALGDGSIARPCLEFEQLRHEVEFSDRHGLLRFRVRIGRDAGEEQER